MSPGHENTPLASRHRFTRLRPWSNIKFLGCELRVDSTLANSLVPHYKESLIPYEAPLSTSRRSLDKVLLIKNMARSGDGLM
jgi:hypothetical protein